MNARRQKILQDAGWRSLPKVVTVTDIRGRTFAVPVSTNDDYAFYDNQQDVARAVATAYSIRDLYGIEHLSIHILSVSRPDGMNGGEHTAWLRGDWDR